MNGKIVLMVSAVLILAAAGCAYMLCDDKADVPSSDTVEFTDARGNTVTLDYPVSGICCIGMHTAEFLNIMGVSDRVVAMDSVSLEMTYAVYGGKVTDVGDAKTPSQDLILEAGTKVVITQDSGRTMDSSIAGTLSSLGVNVVYLDCYGETMFADAESLTELFGAESETRLKDFKEFYQSIDDKIYDTKKETWIEVSYLCYFTSLKKFYNANSELAKILDSYGGHNALTDMVPTGRTVTDSVSKETLYDYDQSEGVDVVILRGSSGTEFSATYAGFVSDCVFEPLSAMKEHWVFVIDTDYLAGPADIIGKICLAYSLGMTDEDSAQRLLDDYISGSASFGISVSGDSLDDFVKAFGE